MRQVIQILNSVSRDSVTARFASDNEMPPNGTENLLVTYTCYGGFNSRNTYCGRPDGGKTNKRVDKKDRLCRCDCYFPKEPQPLLIRDTYFRRDAAVSVRCKRAGAFFTAQSINAGPRQTKQAGLRS